MIRYHLLVALVGAGLAFGDESFFEVDQDFKASHRQLLQVDEAPEEGRADETPKTEEPVKVAPSAGPTRFFTELEGKTKNQFLLTVKNGIKLVKYQDGVYVDTYVLNKEAQGKVSGSIIRHSEDKLWRIFQVDIDWKSEGFLGKNATEINGAHIEMNFNITNKKFELVELKVVKLGGNDAGVAHIDLEVKTKTNLGYGIEAPIGLSFGCGDLGVFKPKNSEGISVGVIFPDIQIQVGKVHGGKFGPVWECGVLLPIGLWVGIIVSLFFAIICCWGFSMLASINTMDRFDDPKGKSINVPNTD